MTPKTSYRHELKYGIAYAEYLVLRQKLKHVMRPDCHTDCEGRYQITSLYFDNSDDKALREKMDGVNRREKFRLRYYNAATSNVMLEKKQKVNGLCLKTSAPLSAQACKRLLEGSPDWPDEDAQPLHLELCFQMNSQLLRPRTIVTYLREPYVHDVGNVRVTFDMDIRTGLACTSFLDPNVITVPTDTSGHMIMEVKYDAFLPGHIMDMLQLGNARAGAHSKYAVCRQYE